ncbi:hypothetical protein ABT186_07465 [Streptomyces sp. NPDC001634]|uniref:hypothetical protein n=1 Tax=Streptomyces sp. NPDC001634 TaxID=3154390 RepID=UPI00333460A8
MQGVGDRFTDLRELQYLLGSERVEGRAAHGFDDKAGARLFLRRLNSRSTQKKAIATWTWSVREDVAPPSGLKPLASYRNTAVK